ncbi:MAG TPA: hypothetical protein VD931_17640 [Baekduia sp.]|nr:hypothetical protein [Baekduia sp.]
MTADEIIDAMLDEVSRLGDAKTVLKRIEAAGVLAGYLLALRERFATEADRASRFSVTLIQVQGAVDRVLDEMRAVERTGCDEAALHAEKWRDRIETEIRKVGR